MKKKQSGLIFYEKKNRVSSELISEMLSLLFYTAIAVAIAWLLVMGFGFRVRMIGASMLPEIKSGQFVFIDRVLYRLKSPKRGDIVAFYPNGNENAHVMIRRVIAMPGETVRIEEGTVYIDDQPETDTGSGYDRVADPGIASGGLTLGEREYFVLGDLRSIGEDSRSPGIGAVNKDFIIGKAWMWTGEGGEQ
ncbi:MAG: signal peptidase I [Lachnospiraceae bacterium]|nr:signal peptidase I [Lachnospiraceae bacterium]